VTLPDLAAPELSVVVVAWRAADDVRELAACFPADERFELVVVDNGGDLAGVGLAVPRLVRVAPGRNLGFAGGCNAGAAASAAPRLLFLNPDARPEPGALERLLEAFERHPGAAGFAPRLVSPDGA
jgi:N-acetylglucosaminyl-diphospho-decaprenol L-rhamnosyltransferase